MNYEWLGLNASIEVSVFNDRSKSLSLFIHKSKFGRGKVWENERGFHLKWKHQLSHAGLAEDKSNLNAASMLQELTFTPQMN